jgi:fructose-1,6-bisphosphatase/sedoheptulose 1,7-bisphosphatase-like protein
LKNQEKIYSMKIKVGDVVSVVESCAPKVCLNLTLAAGALPKGATTGIINIKATDGAVYNVNVYRKAS